MSEESSGSLPGVPADSTNCPFCAQIALKQYRYAGLYAAVLEDGFPRRPGHLLIVPLTHRPRLADLTAPEAAEVFRLAQFYVQDGYMGADGYTLGMNDGAAAGQTVPHTHLHLIPRTFGDVADARGGVRRIFGPDAYLGE